MISRLHYTSLLDAEAHSSRRLQSIRAVEHTSHIDAVCAQFFASIQSHNGHTSTIGPFDSQALHHAFSEEAGDSFNDGAGAIWETNLSCCLE